MQIKGFNLMEIMVTITIIGILSVASYPTFVSYANRNVATDGIVAADKAKLAVQADFIENEVLSATILDANYDFKKGIIRWVNNKIVITYGTSSTENCTINGSSASNCGQLLITPQIVDDQLKWVCTNGDLPNNIDTSIVPGNCK